VKTLAKPHIVLYVTEVRIIALKRVILSDGKKTGLFKRAVGEEQATFEEPWQENEYPVQICDSMLQYIASA